MDYTFLDTIAFFYLLCPTEPLEKQLLVKSELDAKKLLEEILLRISSCRYSGILDSLSSLAIKYLDNADYDEFLNDLKVGPWHTFDILFLYINQEFFEKLNDYIFALRFSLPETDESTRLKRILVFLKTQPL